jgi:hypothetical protein
MGKELGYNNGNKQHSLSAHLPQAAQLSAHRHPIVVLGQAKAMGKRVLDGEGGQLGGVEARVLGGAFRLGDAGTLQQRGHSHGAQRQFGRYGLGLKKVTQIAKLSVKAKCA